MNKDRPILFFDGVCNLCNSAIDFFMRADKKERLRFAPLQGETAKKLLKDDLTSELGTVVLYIEGKVYLRSKAILKSLQIIGSPYSFLSIFLIIPAPISDFFYNLIAKSRYKLFGKRNSCRLPTNEEKKRFLD